MNDQTKPDVQISENPKRLKFLGKTRLLHLQNRYAANWSKS